MPLQLVNTALQRMKLGIKPGNLTPQQVYKLSLECGASYRAAITHLFNVNKISQLMTQSLYQKAPKDIKLELLGGTPLKDARADVWYLDEHDSGRILYPHIQDLLIIDLPEMPSTGFVWTTAENERPHQGGNNSLQGIEGAGILLLLGETFEIASDPGQGLRFYSGGNHRFKFQVQQTGQYSLTLVKRHPWQQVITPVDSFTVHLRITKKSQGLLEQQKTA